MKQNIITGIIAAIALFALMGMAAGPSDAQIKSYLKENLELTHKFSTDTTRNDQTIGIKFKGDEKPFYEIVITD